MKILDGKRVAFTGQLASMTRPEAADLVCAHGGTFVTSVTRKTALLVVGQEGWPLLKDGSLSGKLQTAKYLQAAGCKITILTEEELLERLGMEGATSGIHKQFTLAQLGRLLKVPRDRLRDWMRSGLLKPLDTVQGVCYFDFHQVTGVRTLWDLAQAGVKTETIRRSLEQLTRWIPGLGSSLDQLQLLEQDGQLLMRLDDGKLIEPTGQLHFDFEGQGNEEEVQTSPASFDAEDWWKRGLAQEEDGQLQDAANAYREALYVGGPNVKFCFNLANILYQLGQLGQAAERYRQVVELDHAEFEAWNNLGLVLEEMGEAEEALNAYQHALEIQPGYVEVLYNLAALLEQLNRFSEARRHWKELLRLEPMGQWAEYARRRLAN